jgi:hypothetical protein
MYVNNQMMSKEMAVNNFMYFIYKFSFVVSWKPEGRRFIGVSP